MSVFRYFPGLILIQTAAIGMMIFIVDISQPFAWVKIVSALAILTLTISFWFDAISKQIARDEINTLNQRYAREREKIKIQAEREKSQVIQAGEKKRARDAVKVHSRANMKVGASLSAAAGFGVLMLVTEFITLGLLTIFTAGGAMGGYMLRGKRPEKQLKVINSK